MSSIIGPDRIGIEIKLTSRCNLHCLHCVNRDGGPDGRDLDHDLFIRRLREWEVSGEGMRWPIREVRMTGGEPLLNLPGLAAVGFACLEMGIPSGINTNGSLLTESTAGLLREAGIRVVKISLDTLNPCRIREIRGENASLDAVLKGIGIAVRSGFEVIVRFTLTSLNREELVPCYEYAGEAGAARFQVKPLIQAGRAKEIGIRLTPCDFREAVEDLDNRLVPGSVVPEILCSIPRPIPGLAFKACGSIDKLYISSGGEVFTCNFLESAPLGSMESDSLAELFEIRAARAGKRRLGGHLVLEGCPEYHGRA